MTNWKKASPRHNPYKCSASWHLRKNGLWLAIYNLVGTVTNGGRTDFFGTYQGVASHYGSGYESTRRAFHALTKYGWLERLDDGNYKYVPHEKWVFLNEGKCVVREALSWEDEADPLVGKLFAIAGGKFRIMEWKLKWARKHGSDEEILELFTAEVEKAKAAKALGNWAGTHSSSCFFRVIEHLKHK